ncbi:MAG: histidine phosphatase family protein [Nocardioidaceae bacterium]
MSDLQCACTLLLARHAEADYETDRWSEAGGSLSNAGRHQARALGVALASRRVAHVYTSVMARAVQTAELAAAGLAGSPVAGAGVPVTTREGLREFAVGDAAGSPYSGPDPFAEPFGRWLAGEWDVRMPGGETGREVVGRVRAELAAIADAHRGETVLVVSHGGALRLTVPAVCRMEVPAARIANTAVLELRVDADDWVCTAWQPPPE